MLFDQLPPGILAFLMGISCAIKHTALKRLVYTQWYQQLLWRRHQELAVLFMALCGAMMIYLIFDKFVGVPIAIYLAMVDFGLTLLAGIYAQRVKLFDMERHKHKRAILVIRSVFVLAYASYIWFSLG
jgi:hypothetical protein